MDDHEREPCAEDHENRGPGRQAHTSHHSCRYIPRAVFGHRTVHLKRPQARRGTTAGNEVKNRRFSGGDDPT